MTTLTNGRGVYHSDGLKNIDYTITAGTAKLQIKVIGGDYKDIPDSDKTATTNFNITIPDCHIKLVATGTVVAISSSIG